MTSPRFRCQVVLKNHAFVGGNRRTAYGALVMTLAGNGLRLDADTRRSRSGSSRRRSAEAWEAPAGRVQARLVESSRRIAAALTLSASRDRL